MSVRHSLLTVLPGLREDRHHRACRSSARTLAPSRYRPTSFASDERGTSATRRPGCSARFVTRGTSADVPDTSSAGAWTSGRRAAGRSDGTPTSGPLAHSGVAWIHPGAWASSAGYQPRPSKAALVDARRPAPVRRRPDLPERPTHFHLGSRALVQLDKYYCDRCCPLATAPMPRRIDSSPCDHVSRQPRSMSGLRCEPPGPNSS